MPNVKYDKDIRTGECGSRLYSRWKIVKKQTDDPCFAEYPSFYAWAMASGYTVGARLLLIDVEKPYSRNNCLWEEHPMNPDGKILCGSQIAKSIREWDAFVNRIRKQYGMKAIYSSEVFYEQE